MSGHSPVRVSRAYEIISLRDGLKRWHMTKKVFAVRVDCCDSATTFIIGGSSHEKAEKVLVRSQFFEEEDFQKKFQKLDHSKVPHKILPSLVDAGDASKILRPLLGAIQG